jgi:hypothetical protein
MKGQPALRFLVRFIVCFCNAESKWSMIRQEKNSLRGRLCLILPLPPSIEAIWLLAVPRVRFLMPFHHYLGHELTYYRGMFSLLEKKKGGGEGGSREYFFLSLPSHYLAIQLACQVRRTSPILRPPSQMMVVWKWSEWKMMHVPIA